MVESVPTAVAAFALVALLITVTPGLDTFLTIRMATAHGRSAAFAANLGIGCGCVVWAAAGAAGLTAVLAASRFAYDGLRLAGAAYLVFLGVRALLAARTRRAADGRGDSDAAGDAGDHDGWVAAAGGRVRSHYRVGLTTNLLNPKIGAFYLSALPQFLPADSGPRPSVVALGALLGVVHALEGVAWCAVLVLAVNRARRWLARPSVRRGLERVLGTVFIGFGIRLAIGR